MSKEQGSESAESRSQFIKEEKVAEEKEAPKKVSRREFVKGAAAVAGAGALASCAPAATPAPGETAAPAPTCPPAAECAPCPVAGVPETWDEEADVVVVGMGLGALCAAIEAHDAGAKVVILEKAPEGRHGGTSRVCGQLLVMPPPEMEEATFLYHKNSDYADLVDEDVHRAFAAELVKVEPWILSLGGEVDDYQFSAIFDVPGNESFVVKKIAPSAEPSSGWMFFEKQVNDRGIEIMFETPARSLVASPEREVMGVKAESQGSDMYIKAKRGVVLGTGGFEANQTMLKNYAMGYPAFYDGTPYNTGDGIRMAEALGADLVAMNNMALPRRGGCIRASGFDAPFRTNLQGGGNGFIYVNKFGERFINEFKTEVYSYDWRHIILFEKERMTFPQIPWYGIFDQTRLDARPLFTGSGWNGLVEGYEWSPDNQAELAKGWILEADSLETVASKIAELPGNEGKMDSSTLTATMDAYDQACSDQLDPVFNRPAENLVPISGPPYYIVELWPLIHFTGGGPKRDAQARIVNVEGEPIPRLYSVGEMGAWWGSGYNGGFIEGPPSGRIAGKNAAAEEPWA